MTEELEKHRFDVGCIWEGPGWCLRIQAHCQGCDPCPHVRTLKPDDPEWQKDILAGVREPAWAWEQEPQFIVPRLIVAHNEGGHATTGMCLDCILDACNKIGDTCMRLGPAEGLHLREYLRMADMVVYDDQRKLEILSKIAEQLKK